MHRTFNVFRRAETINPTKAFLVIVIIAQARRMLNHLATLA
jgi:hypothetical protein